MKLLWNIVLQLLWVSCGCCSIRTLGQPPPLNIEQWFAGGRDTSPNTGAHLPRLYLVPYHALRNSDNFNC